MIDKETLIAPGMIVTNDTDDRPEKLTYEITATDRIDNSGWEQTHVLAGKLIDYTQLVDGGMPAGTEYGKPEGEFRNHFTIVQ